MRQLKQPIFYLRWLLIILSFIALLFALYRAFTLPFELSTEGFQLFLNLFDPYKILFAATFVVITANLAIDRLYLMSEANINAYKAANRTVWIQTVRGFFPEVEEREPILCKEVGRLLLSIHDYLFDRDYVISSETGTRAFFERYFASRVRSFEEHNRMYMSIACYQNNTQSFSWVNFRYLLAAMVNIDGSYEGFLTDIEQLYRAKVLEFSTPQIDAELYHTALIEYSRRRAQGHEM